MSEAMTMPPLADAPAKRTPTVYFIDDSATMREVIKIAFRRESRTKIPARVIKTRIHFQGFTQLPDRFIVAACAVVSGA